MVRRRTALQFPQSGERGAGQIQVHEAWKREQVLDGHLRRSPPSAQEEDSTGWSCLLFRGVEGGAGGVWRGAEQLRKLTVPAIFGLSARAKCSSCESLQTWST